MGRGGATAVVMAPLGLVICMVFVLPALVETLVLEHVVNFGVEVVNRLAMPANDRLDLPCVLIMFTPTSEGKSGHSARDQAQGNQCLLIDVIVHLADPSAKFVVFHGTITVCVAETDHSFHGVQF